MGAEGFRKWGLAAAGVAVLALVVVWRTPGGGKLDMQFGDASLKLDTKQDLASLDAFLEKVKSNPKAQVQFVALLKAGGIYPINDPALADGIAGLKPGDGVAQRIEELVRKEQGPFRKTLRAVRLSFPGDPGFRDGEAVACSGSEWADRSVTIFDKAQERNITVKVNRRRACPEGDIATGGVENVQVTARMGRTLFRDRPLNKFEDALIGASSH